jgi:hypothetical protein
VTTTPTQPLAAQALTLLEAVIDECVQKALARHTPPQIDAPLWIDAKEASALLGSGYPPARIKQLGHLGELVMDRREPDKPNSPYIFERQSVLNFSSRRVFQLDQRGHK